MLLDLEDKVVVVTGAGRGIGRAIAESFLREGSRVIVTDVSAEALDWFEPGAAGGAAEVCDVRDTGRVNDVINSVAARFGGIDVLVNNAGIMGEGFSKHWTTRPGTAASTSTSAGCSRCAGRWCRS